MSQKRIALVACEAFPDLDDEDRLLLPALAALGIDAQSAVWTDAGVDWAAFDAVVIRETWDYHERFDQFQAWISRVSDVSTLLNTAPTIMWNTDKRYLRDLAAAGVPVVPTVFLDPADPDANDWTPPADATDIVVKPAVSAGSNNTLRHHVDESLDAARTHARRLLDEDRVVMVQPYLDLVDTHGETALLFFDGEYSHAIRKGPMLERGVEFVIDGLFLEESVEVRTPSDGERTTAERVLAAIPPNLGRPLYARVDLIPDADGQPRLLELELTEPSLFLSYDDAALGRLAAAIAARLGTPVH